MFLFFILSAFKKKKKSVVGHRPSFPKVLKDIGSDRPYPAALAHDVLVMAGLRSDGQ